MQDKPFIDMGHGQLVNVIDKGSGQWEIVFSEEGNSSYSAPPVAEIGVDAIDIAGKVTPLQVSEGPNPSTVIASGDTANAYRVRVRVWHDTHFHTREAFLRGSRPIEATKGPNGGTVAVFNDGLQVEVRSLEPSKWELIFLNENKPTSPLPADQVVVQAIGPITENSQVRNLAITPSSEGNSLIAEGKIRDATYARVSIGASEQPMVRSIPLIPAA
ncbi:MULTISPECIES: hypothetical protein [Chelativorans]|jgi:hypothetical protein|uniref:Uncharacterized protein n=1 Tax=Chelativorans sp. (strain BNC1) TaxID=266779 RepID=Q11KW7_CHESB|nr:MULTISPECIES: hypothetical protein [Chelativorans]